MQRPLNWKLKPIKGEIMKSPAVACFKFRSLVALTYRKVEDYALQLTIGFTATFYMIRYFSYDATPGNAPMDHPLGWWGWFDQGKYLQSVNAFYAGNLDPINHFYPPLYPLLGVLGRWISSGHPFFFINLASYCIYALCFTNIANQYFSRVASVAIWIAISIGSVYVVDLFVIPWTTSLQSCIISISFVYILRISHQLAINQRFPKSEAAFAGLNIGLLVANRPGDIPISLFLLGFCIYQLLSRKNHAELNGRYKKVGLIIGAWIVGLLLLSFINNAIYGSILGSYVQTAGANGYFPGEFLNKFVSLFLDSKSLFLEGGLAIIDVIPWMPLVIAGALSFLVIGKGILRTAVLVSSVYFALFVPYGDLLPNGMWRYLNFHYFAWTVPYFVLAFFAFLRQIGASRLRFKFAAISLSAIFLISIYSFGFKTVFSNVSYFKVESGISTIEFPRQESINFIDFPDLKSDFQSAYFGNNHVLIDGVEQKKVRDFRLIESEGVVRLLFQKRINANKIQVIFDKNVQILDTRFRVGRVSLAAMNDRNSKNEIPIPLNSKIKFSEGGNGGK